MKEPEKQTNKQKMTKMGKEKGSLCSLFSERAAELAVQLERLVVVKLLGREEHQKGNRKARCQGLAREWAFPVG